MEKIKCSPTFCIILAFESVIFMTDYHCGDSVSVFCILISSVSFNFIVP